MGSLRGNSTFLKSYHSMGSVELNIPHYSLIARSQALRRYFLEHGSGKARCRISKILIESRTLPLCAAGSATWILRDLRFPFCALPWNLWGNG